jgi:hypothetical protein
LYNAAWSRHHERSKAKGEPKRGFRPSELIQWEAFWDRWARYSEEQQDQWYRLLKDDCDERWGTESQACRDQYLDAGRREHAAYLADLDSYVARKLRAVGIDPSSSSSSSSSSSRSFPQGTGGMYKADDPLLLKKSWMNAKFGS